MDPYKVLGVSEDASMDEIRAAYKKLVRKYHPDQYQNNPLSELAQEKLKEINQAYDILQKRHEGTGGSSSGGGAHYSSGSSGQNARVRNMINSGNLAGAQAELNRQQTRDAEWYYLYGVIYMQQGQYDQARQMFSQAVSMDPGNGEYQSAYNQVQNVSSYYSNPYRRNQNGRSVGVCDICSTLCCMEMCCNCMGGC